jgi:alcohol/geraniol dehydrogenase (NADP+)
LKKAANSFDFILSTASGTGLDFPALVEALRPGGTLCVTAPPEATISVSAMALLAKEKRIVGGRTGSPTDTAKMLEFSARHGIKPMLNKFKMSDVNAAVDLVRTGKARYRVVMEA